jgi:HTH-type transcriptional regulator/antitoxin MqsA
MPSPYKGESTAIPTVTGDFCPTCWEVVLNLEHGDRYSEWVGLFQHQAPSAYVDPNDIAKGRKKLNLDQRQATERFGTGDLIMKRWPR